ncbi:MAG: DNA polymerase I, partial [Actinocatenispora sp.]
VTALSLAVDDGAAACHLDPAKLDAADDAALAAFLADPGRPKILHDAKPVLLALRSHGWRLDGLATDTALAAYLVRPDQRSYDLADLSVRYLHRELRTEEPDDGQMTLDGLGEALGSQAAEQQLMLRARATLDLAGALRAELVEQHAPDTSVEEGAATSDQRGIELLTELEQPLSRVLADMEATGIAADTDYLSELEAHFAGEVKTAAQGAYDVVGREFNLGSPKQRQQLLFEELGLPKTKRTKTGYTTDADSLVSLYASTEHPVLPHLLRYADVSKLRSMVEGLLKSVGDDGRIHTTFKQTVAATGRLSSTEPNLQNIPIRSEEGRRLRRAFVVGAKHQELLTADYSQIEMRIMAHLSGDEALIEAFVSGADFHAATAARVFGVPPEEVTGEQRSKIKAMNYGLAYGLSAYGLSGQLSITPDEARGLMDEYFERFGGVRDYLRGLVEQARRDGYTETMLGRRRYLPDLTSDNRQRREMSERMALNAPIQGSAADIIKIAMLRVDERLRGSGLSSRMLLQVHDELVFEVAAGERTDLEALVRAEMGGATELRVPLSVSVGVGGDWNTAGH